MTEIQGELALLVKRRTELDQMIAEVEGDDGDPSPARAVRETARRPRRRWLRPVR